MTILRILFPAFATLSVDLLVYYAPGICQQLLRVIPQVSTVRGYLFSIGTLIWDQILVSSQVVDYVLQELQVFSSHISCTPVLGSTLRPREIAAFAMSSFDDFLVEATTAGPGRRRLPGCVLAAHKDGM